MGLCASPQVPMRYPLLVIAFSLRNPESCDGCDDAVLDIHSGVEFGEIALVFLYVGKPLAVVGADGVGRVLGVVAAVDDGEGGAERELHLAKFGVLRMVVH